MTIYQQMKAAGVPMDNHESDLYVPKNEVTSEIIHKAMREGELKSFVDIFMSERDNEWWYDIPFAYQPFWNEKSKGKV